MRKQKEEVKKQRRRRRRSGEKAEKRPRSPAGCGKLERLAEFERGCALWRLSELCSFWQFSVFFLVFKRKKMNKLRRRSAREREKKKTRTQWVEKNKNTRAKSSITLHR